MTLASLAAAPLPDWRASVPGLIEAALVLFVAWQAARLAWLAWPASPGLAHVPVPAPEPPGGPALMANGFDPFFPARGAAGAAAGGFTLHAVRHGAQPGAIVGDANGVQRARQVGDTIAPGVVLAGIGDGDATLRISGRPHRILLPRMTQADAAPSSATSAVATQPAIAKPPTTGLRIDADHPALAAAGLRRGDIVVAVDGRPPAADLLATLPVRLARGDRVAVTVRRAGRNAVLTLQAPHP